MSSRTGIQLTTKWERKVRRGHYTERKKRHEDNKREVLKSQIQKILSISVNGLLSNFNSKFK